MASLWADVRYGLRLLRRTPGFALLVVAVLALGIGANSAIFSIVNAVLLRPLPYASPERLYRLEEVNPKGDPLYPPLVDSYAFAERGGAVEGVAVSRWENGTLTGPEGADNVFGAKASAELFPLLGVQPALGRGFRPDEFRPGAPGVVLLSDRLWRRRYHADPGVVGRSLMINGKEHAIAGVLAAGFFYYQNFEYWAPWQMTGEERSSRDGARVPTVVRLRAGVPPAQLETELSSQFRNLAADDVRKGWKIRLTPLHDTVTARSRPALLTLLGAVGFVLLIACLNVANLLLARGADRGREMAIRAALGAGRMRAVRQLLTESVLLAGAGGVFGLALGHYGARGLLALFPPQIGLPRLDQTGMDVPVLGFTLGVSLLTAVLFGLVPAWECSRADVAEALKAAAGRSASGGARARWWRNGLIVAETALSVVLLAGAGLMVESFRQLNRADAGFRPERVLTLRVPPPVGVSERPQLMAHYARLLETVQNVPGLNAAGLVAPLPLSGVDSNGTFSVEGRPRVPGERVLVRLRIASAGYFPAMGLTLLRGRGFQESDDANAPMVVVVNDALARRYFPGEDTVGRRVSMSDSGRGPWYTIVGVIRNTKAQSIQEEAAPEMYRPYRQFFFAPFSTALVLRTQAEDPGQAAATVQRYIRAAFPDQPVVDVFPMPEVVSRSLAQPRFYTLLLAIFAGLALLLAAAGLYGVLGYAVSQRTREIGIRVALGASRGAILRIVMGHALAVVSGGVVLGIAGSVALTRFLAAQLYGVKPTDPLVFAGVCFLLTGVAAVAAFQPARRALSVDPNSALRGD